GAENLGPPTREVIVALRGGHHLDGAAGETVAQRPDRATARVVLRPLEHISDAGQRHLPLLAAGNILARAPFGALVQHLDSDTARDSTARRGAIGVICTHDEGDPFRIGVSSCSLAWPGTCMLRAR